MTTHVLQMPKTNTFSLFDHLNPPGWGHCRSDLQLLFGQSQPLQCEVVQGKLLPRRNIDLAINQDNKS